MVVGTLFLLYVIIKIPRYKHITSMYEMKIDFFLLGAPSMKNGGWWRYLYHPKLRWPTYAHNKNNMRALIPISAHMLTGPSKIIWITNIARKTQDVKLQPLQVPHLLKGNKGKVIEWYNTNEPKKILKIL